jgi:hypothetical protein
MYIRINKKKVFFFNRQVDKVMQHHVLSNVVMVDLSVNKLA